MRKLYVALVAVAMILAACGGIVLAETPTETAGPNLEATIVALLEDLVAAQVATEEPPEAPPTAEPTEEPTEAPVVESTAPAEDGLDTEAIAASQVSLIGGVVMAANPAPYTISGIPETVEIAADEMARLVTSAEMLQRDPTENVNSLGLLTQYFLADAGVFLTHSVSESEANESAWLITPDTQFLLSYFGPAQANLPEGGFLWGTAAEMTMEAFGYTIDTEAMYGHCWFVVLSGQDWDHMIDTDFNTPVLISGYNPGFIQIDRFPPGAYLSQQHFLENTNSAHEQKTSGSDGCSNVTAMFLAVRNGAMLVINQPAPNAKWVLVDTNIMPAQ
jgi:hypothetical protein